MTNFYKKMKVGEIDNTASNLDEALKEPKDFIQEREDKLKSIEGLYSEGKTARCYMFTFNGEITHRNDDASCVVSGP